jgi:hypothetical protein
LFAIVVTIRAIICKGIHTHHKVLTMAAMTDVEYYFITFLLVLTSTFILQYILRRLTKHSTHLCLPPSPPALPLIGHLHYLSPAAYKCLHIAQPLLQIWSSSLSSSWLLPCPSCLIRFNGQRNLQDTRSQFCIQTKISILLR